MHKQIGRSVQWVRQTLITLRAYWRKIISGLSVLLLSFNRGVVFQLNLKIWSQGLLLECQYGKQQALAHCISELSLTDHFWHSKNKSEPNHQHVLLLPI